MSFAAKTPIAAFHYGCVLWYLINYLRDLEVGDPRKCKKEYGCSECKWYVKEVRDARLLVANRFGYK
jgi:hypothetical protein